MQHCLQHLTLLVSISSSTKQYPNETICLSEALFFIAKDGSTNTKAPVKQLSPPSFLNGSLFSLFFWFCSIACIEISIKLSSKLSFTLAVQWMASNFMKQIKIQTLSVKVNYVKNNTKKRMFLWVTTRLCFSVKLSSGKVLLPDSHEKNEACITSLCSYRNAH